MIQKEGADHMSKYLTFYDLVPKIPIEYSGQELRILLDTARTDASWAKKNLPDLTYAKVSTETLWFILATLKKLRGKKTFNDTTRIRYWDIGLVMVDTQKLSDTELAKALNFVKRFLLTNGINPKNGPYHEQVVHSILSVLFKLHPAMSFRTNRQLSTPEWDAIHPKMDLSKWI